MKVLSILPLLILSSQAIADTGPRDTLHQMLQFYGQDALSTSASGLPATEESVDQMIQNYRLKRVKGTSSIADAPFVGYILQNQVVPSYASIEQSEYDGAYKANVTDATLEDLFDTFMSQVEKGGLSGDIAKAGNEIGSCLAKKVEKGKGPSCVLDVTDNVSDDKPGILELGAMKFSCWFPFFSPCKIRKTIYTLAKPALIQMRPEWPDLFKDAYPESFRDALMNGNTSAGIIGVNPFRSNIASIVSSKFGADYTDQSPPSFWSAAPLVDLDGSGRTMTLHQFATGMSNDLRAASLLLKSPDNDTKSLAGALFYAGANRLLVLMGGTEAKWGGSQFLEAPDSIYDPKNPLNAPHFLTEPFGGLTAEKTSKGEQMLGLDIANYNPNPSANAPVQLFPSQFVMGEQGIPTLDGEPVESLQDLSDLLNGLVDFMELSAPSGALSSHFVSAASIADLIDPMKPGLFPSEGRQLAAGLIAAIFQNVLVDQGHLQQPPADGAPVPAPDPDHDGAFGLKFYDQVGFNGRLPGKVSLDSLSSLFTAAIRFNNLMNTKDPAIPDALMKLQDQVDLVINLGLLTIASNGQAADGGFVTNLGDATAGKTPTGRTLSVCVNALRTLTAGYAANPSGAVRQAIHAGWAYMDRFWANASAPLAVEPQSGVASTDQAGASPETLWAAMNLWAETKNTAIYADLNNPALDPDWQSTQGWDKWAGRFSTLPKSR